MLALGAACGDDNPRPAGDEPRVVTGVVTKVDSVSLNDVKGFTVTSKGQNYEFQIDPSITYGFPPSHLHAHLASSEPVRVEYEERDGELVATSVDDG